VYVRVCAAAQALQCFQGWVEGCGALEQGPAGCLPVTWGDWDLRVRATCVLLSSSTSSHTSSTLPARLWLVTLFAQGRRGRCGVLAVVASCVLAQSQCALLLYASLAWLHSGIRNESLTSSRRIGAVHCCFPSSPLFVCQNDAVVSEGRSKPVISAQSHPLLMYTDH
jgi:hypothetical protein